MVGNFEQSFVTKEDFRKQSGKLDNAIGDIKKTLEKTQEKQSE